MRDDNTTNVITDIWRETTWSVRLGLFGGLIVGFLVGFVIAGNFAIETDVGAGSRSVVRAGVGVLILIVGGCTVGGGVSGLFLGVLADFVVEWVRGPDAEKQKRRRRR
jgi:hypothetical protein